MDIQDLRKEIDAIDQELVSLFCRRMNVAAEIANYKRQNNLPIYHPGRELEVLQKVTAMASPDLGAYVQELYSVMFALSKRYQTEHNE